MSHNGTEDKMYGVVDGVYYCNQQRTELLNKRIYSRNIPSSSLQAQFGMRPVSSKYSIMPIYDRQPMSKEPIIRQPNYNIHETFNPGNAMAPWEGFAEHVNDESRLRRQFFALQKCDQPGYVPSTHSDMYVSQVKERVETQPYPGLFTEQKFDTFNPNECNLGRKFFDNNTRVQLKNLSSNNI